MDLELLDRRRRRAVGDAIVGDVRHAVDREVVLLLADAVGRELRQAVVEGGLARPQIGRHRHAGREDDQLHRAALANRQLRDPPRVDDLTELGGRAIDRRADAVTFTSSVSAPTFRAASTVSRSATWTSIVSLTNLLKPASDDRHR